MRPLLCYKFALQRSHSTLAERGWTRAIFMPPLSGLGESERQHLFQMGQHRARGRERGDDGGVCITRGKLIDIGAQLNKQEAEQREADRGGERVA